MKTEPTERNYGFLKIIFVMLLAGKIYGIGPCADYNWWIITSPIITLAIATIFDKNN